MQFDREGLKTLSDIITFCQEQDYYHRRSSGRSASNRALQDASGVNQASIGRIKNAHKGENFQKFNMESLYGLAPSLWIPGSGVRDRTSGKESDRLYFAGDELRAIAEGRAHLLTLAQMSAVLDGGELDGLNPFTEAIEKRRRERRHSYEELCRVCLFEPGSENRIRRLLAFCGWAVDHGAIVGDVLGLARYIAADVQDPEALQKAAKEISRLHEASVHGRSLNGASA